MISNHTLPSLVAKLLLFWDMNIYLPFPFTACYSVSPSYRGWSGIQLCLVG